MIIKAFPDAHWGIEKLFENIFNGTYKGEFQGILPTGNKVEVGSIFVLRIFIVCDILQPPGRT